MSTSKHPIALRLEGRVGDTVRLLAVVMGLPLLDGVFAALVLAGALDTYSGVLQVGLLVFGGSATLAVVLADMEDDPRAHVGEMLALGVGLAVLAGIEAAIAPTLRTALDLATFERFAAVVLLAIAAKTASARVGDLLPRPAIVVGLGLIASLEPQGARLIVQADAGLVLRAAAAAGVATAFAVSLALFAPTLRRLVDLDRFRFGSAIALGVLPFSLLGIVPGPAPLAVLVVGGLLAFDPDSSATAEERRREMQVAADGGPDEREPWL